MNRVNTTESLRIGEVAKLTGLTTETLRFYDREGLLTPALRSSNGARRFPADVVARVKFVKQAQTAGLTLKDIKSLVQLPRGRSRSACQRMLAVVTQRLRDIDARLEELQSFRTELATYAAACSEALGSGSEPECPSLDALQSQKLRARKDARP